MFMFTKSAVLKHRAFGLKGEFELGKKRQDQKHWSTAVLAPS